MDGRKKYWYHLHSFCNISIVFFKPISLFSGLSRWFSATEQTRWLWRRRGWSSALRQSKRKLKLNFKIFSNFINPTKLSGPRIQVWKNWSPKEACVVTSNVFALHSLPRTYVRYSYQWKLKETDPGKAGIWFLWPQDILDHKEFTSTIPRTIPLSIKNFY